MAKRGQAGVGRRRFLSSSLNKYVGEYMATNSGSRYYLFSSFSENVSNAFWSALQTIEKNYQLVYVLITVIILSLHLPNVRPKVHIASQMQEVQSALEKMAVEVNHAAKMCAKTAEDVYLFFQDMASPVHKKHRTDFPQKINLRFINTLERTVNKTQDLPRNNIP